MWVDAVCIGQSSVVERNAQVTMMGQIYGNAVLIFVWLGADSPESVRFFKHFRGVNRIDELDDELEESGRSPLGSVYKSFNHL